MQYSPSLTKVLRLSTNVYQKVLKHQFSGVLEMDRWKLVNFISLSRL